MRVEAESAGGGGPVWVGGHPPDAGYRVAVRPDDRGEVDDVVVRDVSCFRLERMDEGYWFMCCFLGDPSDGNRIAFNLTRRGRDVIARVTEWPRGVEYEERSLRDPD